MSAWLNNLLVIAAITAAVGYFVWHSFGRRRKGGSGCGGGCGCSAAKKGK